MAAPIPASPTKNDDLAGFCLPNFAACSPAVNDVVPAIMEAVEYLTSMAWTSAACDGSKDFKQNPPIACWTNLPLARNMSQITGYTYESECLKLCALSCCMLYCCYYGSKRGEFRRKYGLKGAPLLDCLGWYCIGPCLMCQDAIELQAIGGYAIPFCSEADAAKATQQVQKGATAVATTTKEVAGKAREAVAGHKKPADAPNGAEAHTGAADAPKAAEAHTGAAEAPKAAAAAAAADVPKADETPAPTEPPKA